MFSVEMSNEITVLPDVLEAVPELLAKVNIDIADIPLLFCLLLQTVR